MAGGPRGFDPSQQPGDLLPQTEQLLRWASWALTLPVMVFSCRPIFSSAFNDLKRGRLGMDVPVALGVLITFAVSMAGTFDPAGAFGREVYFDSLTMFVFFLLTARWLELRLRDQTSGALEGAAHLVRAGGLAPVSATSARATSSR